MSGGDGPAIGSAAPKPAKKPPTRRKLFNFRQLNVLTVAIILSAAGLVSATDFAFVLFSIIYMHFLSRVAFPNHSPDSEPLVFGERNTILGVYVLVAAVIGLLLPTAYIFEGILEGDRERVKAAAPHVFLLASQVFMEGVSFWGNFSLPIRVFVPVLYNSRRVFTIVEWLSDEFGEVGFGGWRVYVGRILSVVNMAFWCFNLFGFLLPVYLPKSFKIYYQSNNKVKD